MTSVLEPWTSHADVVSGALAMDLQQEESVSDVLPIPRIKGSQQLEPVTKIKQ